MDASSPGERSHPVWIAPRFAHDVLDWYSSGYQSIRDERTMAAPRHCFGAHDRGSVFSGSFDEGLKCRVEFLRLHVVRIATKRGILPSAVHRIRLWLPQPAERLHVHVFNPRGLKRRLQCLGPKLRIMPRPWHGSDIDE